MFENFHLEPQVIIFIVVAVIGILRSLFSKKKQPQERETWEEESWEEDSWEERNPEPQQKKAEGPLAEFRRMIEEAKAEAEAKYNPKEETPQQTPPQQTPQPSAQPSAHPPTLVVPPQVSLPQTIPEAVITPPLPTPAGPSITSHDQPVLPTPSKKRKKKKSKTSVKDLLQSPSAAKQAIILTEVLGKPKSLR